MFRKVYLHPGHHAGYYPGARSIHIKLVFSPENGQILGTQAVGMERVEKRTTAEFDTGHIEGAVNIPPDDLRGRMNSLPPGQAIWVCCTAGQRAYCAVRALRLYGFDARNLTGGFETYNAMFPEKDAVVNSQQRTRFRMR